MKQQSTHEKLKTMMIISIFTAIICILAQVTIPLPIVPITGQTLAIGLAATILGSRKGTLAVGLYLILGAVGLPVFAGMSGGVGIIVGPTGGYLLSYLPVAFLTGFLLEKTKFTIFNAILANILGMILTLVLGTLWLKVTLSLTWTAAFYSGSAPFILVGLIKAFLAGYLGITVYQRLKSARLLPVNTKKSGSY